VELQQPVSVEPVADTEAELPAAYEVKHFVGIAGNIGVGKSTLTRLLSRKLGWEPFFEAVNDNPYLPDFYQEMSRWSFHSQVYFLSHRLRHHWQLIERAGSVLQDRTVYEDAEIFACNLYRQGFMDERDYAAYRDLYEIAVTILPPPDLIVYLRASVEVLRERIRRRGRSFEQAMAPMYLERLSDLYEEWAASFTLCPVLAIPTDDLNFVSNGLHLSWIVDRVMECLEAGRKPCD
jgi:deoxyadenosine/deoxycytidine kinase